MKLAVTWGYINEAASVTVDGDLDEIAAILWTLIHRPRQASICDVQARSVPALKRILLAALDSAQKRSIETVEVSRYNDPTTDLACVLEQIEDCVVERGETCGLLWSGIGMDLPQNVNFHIAGGDTR